MSELEFIEKNGNRIARSSHSDNTTWSTHIFVHPEVERALKHRKPVVALESTIITHGMPWPENMRTALEVEGLVRQNGATPATIGIINGQIRVGMSPEDVEALASGKLGTTIKCSRRDLAFAVSHSLCGGTTVAATMFIAHKVGVEVFATGGIGGVHHFSETTMDISADLIELGRTPVTVICGGIKSILDIPKTLEFLETQGVCVATYGRLNCMFPDFFTRDSGCRATYNLQTAVEAANLIRSSRELGINAGIVIGVPIPEEYAADRAVIRSAIDHALLDAKANNISGKDATPYLLQTIAKITGGDSLKANMALIKNNAIVAAKIANHLYGHRTEGLALAPLVIGASIVDLAMTVLGTMPETFNGASYRTKTRPSAGGVGHNLAEGILKMYGNINFISAIGNDALGDCLLSFISDPLKTNINIESKHATSVCSVLFDNAGDCKLVLGNMEIHESIDPSLLMLHEQLLCDAPLIVIDSNLSLAAIQCTLELAHKHARPVFFEPTDMRLSAKPFNLDPALTKQIRMISPNVYELKEMVETITKESFNLDDQMIHNKERLLRFTREMLLLIEKYFDIIIVSLGRHGIVVSSRGTKDITTFDPMDGLYLLLDSNSKMTRMRNFYPAQAVKNLVNVSGAGDSFCSAFITGMLKGYTMERCVALGVAATKPALLSESAVPNQYFTDDHDMHSLMEETLAQHKKTSIAI